MGAQARLHEAWLLAERWKRSDEQRVRIMGADLAQVLEADPHDPMPAGWNRPAPASRERVVETLHDAAEAVDAGDSFEGFIQWVMPTDEPELADAEFGLMARYRIGNHMGQGGLRVYEGRGDGG